MSKSDEAFLIQEKISKLIEKLDKLGFEFMFFNMQSSIRRKRKWKKLLRVKLKNYKTI